MTKNEKENIKNAITSIRSDVTMYENIVNSRFVALKQKVALIEEGNKHLIADLPQLAHGLAEARKMLIVASNNLGQIEKLLN